MEKIILSLIAICLMIGAPTAMASMGLWLADDSVVPPDMVVYHLFIDGVNPVRGQNGTDNRKTMELSHDGLRLCLGTYVCHKITVTPSAFNATYDTGFFLVPANVNQSELGMPLETMYQNVGVGVGLDGRPSHIDMDMLYTDVIVVRSCIENYHVHPGTDKFHECYERLSQPLNGPELTPLSSVM